MTNWFPLKPESVSKNHTYIFVLFNLKRLFIVAGSKLKGSMKSFYGASLSYPDGVVGNFGPLRAFVGNWATSSSNRTPN